MTQVASYINSAFIRVGQKLGGYIGLDESRLCRARAKSVMPRDLLHTRQCKFDAQTGCRTQDARPTAQTAPKQKRGY